MKVTIICLFITTSVLCQPLNPGNNASSAANLENIEEELKVSEGAAKEFLSNATFTTKSDSTTEKVTSSENNESKIPKKLMEEASIELNKVFVMGITHQLAVFHNQICASGYKLNNGECTKVA